MDDHNGFDSVSWPRDPETNLPVEPPSAGFPPTRNDLPDRTRSSRSLSRTTEPQAGENADAVDLAGVGADGVLECTVDTPLKESDGTKDAYVSYLITTHVRSPQHFYRST